MATFVRTIEMKPGDPERLTVRADHREYVARLFSAGSIRMSGPWVDDTGAQLVYEAADLSSVQTLIDDDPYTTAGVVREVSLREWNVIVGG